MAPAGDHSGGNAVVARPQGGKELGLVPITNDAVSGPGLREWNRAPWLAATLSLEPHHDLRHAGEAGHVRLWRSAKALSRGCPTKGDVEPGGGSEDGGGGRGGEDGGEQKKLDRRPDASAGAGPDTADLDDVVGPFQQRRGAGRARWLRFRQQGRRMWPLADGSPGLHRLLGWPEGNGSGAVAGSGPGAKAQGHEGSGCSGLAGHGSRPRSSSGPGGSGWAEGPAPSRSESKSSELHPTGWRGWTPAGHRSGP